MNKTLEELKEIIKEYLTVLYSVYSFTLNINEEWNVRSIH